MLKDSASLPNFGDMAGIIRAYDWSATSLGAMAEWPVALRCAVDLALPSSAQIVMFCGPEFVSIYNDAYAPTIGSKHPGALGKPGRENWGELWHDLEPMLRRVMDNGETVSAKDRAFYIERPMPETVYFDISYSPVFDADKRVVAVFCIVNETTQRVRYEEALRESEARLRSIIDHTAVGVIQADLDGRLSFVNPGFCELVGYSRDELLGRTLQDLTHPEDLPANMAKVRAMGEDGESVVVEKRYLRKDGVPIWVSNHISALRNSRGEIREGVGVVVDITARRRVVEAERRLAAIINSSEDAILGIDLDMIITDWNRGAEKVYGYTPEEVVGKSVTILIPAERVDEERRIVERIKAGDRVEPHDTVRRHKDGYDVEVSLSVAPIFDEQGRIVGASKSARDISARMEAERITTILIAELNHRVKNVLATVSAIARQTFARASDIELATATFDARLRSMARAHDLLTHGNWQGASLDRIVREALSPYATDRVEIGGQDTPVSPKLVLALSLILHELATNAAKYGALSTDAGRVSVSWSIEDSVSPKLLLDWKEAGGPLVTAPTRKGFGSRLIQSMLSGESGSVRSDYHLEGLHCHIEASLEADWASESSHPID